MLTLTLKKVRPQVPGRRWNRVEGKRRGVRWRTSSRGQVYCWVHCSWWRRATLCRWTPETVSSSFLTSPHPPQTISSSFLTVPHPPETVSSCFITLPHPPEIVSSSELFLHFHTHQKQSVVVLLHYHTHQKQSVVLNFSYISTPTRNSQ